MLILSSKPTECVRLVIPASSVEQVVFVGVQHIGCSAVKLGFVADTQVSIARTKDALPRSSAQPPVATQV